MGNRRLRRATEREMTESVVIGDLERNIYLHEHKDVELAPESELIKEHLERLTALERKISAQVVDNTYVQTTAPNCQGQCGICDGTCNNAGGQQRHS